MKIVPLSRTHNRKLFDCGNEDLNRFFRQYASQAVRNRDCTCYVAVEDDEELVGFFTLSAAEIAFEKIRKFGVRSGYSSVPFVRLGRLAVSLSFQGRGIGHKLVAAASSISQAQAIGTKGLVVEAKTDELLSFYEQLGFLRLTDSAPSRQAVLLFPMAKLT